jgi:hypothetical protein
MPLSCSCVFPRKEGGIQVLARMAPSSQAMGSYLTTSWRVRQDKRKITLLARILLEVGMPRSCSCVFSGKEGGIQVLVGLAPSSQRVGSLLTTPVW